MGARFGHNTGLWWALEFSDGNPDRSEKLHLQAHSTKDCNYALIRSMLKPGAYVEVCSGRDLFQLLWRLAKRHERLMLYDLGKSAFDKLP